MTSYSYISAVPPAVADVLSATAIPIPTRNHNHNFPSHNRNRSHHRYNSHSSHNSHHSRNNSAALRQFHSRSKLSHSLSSGIRSERRTTQNTIWDQQTQKHATAPQFYSSVPPDDETWESFANSPLTFAVGTSELKDSDGMPITGTVTNIQISPSGRICGLNSFDSLGSNTESPLSDDVTSASPTSSFGSTESHASFSYGSASSASSTGSTPRTRGPLSPSGSAANLASLAAERHLTPVEPVAADCHPLAATADAEADAETEAEADATMDATISATLNDTGPEPDLDEEMSDEPQEKSPKHSINSTNNTEPTEHRTTQSFVSNLTRSFRSLISKPPSPVLSFSPRMTDDIMVTPRGTPVGSATATAASATSATVSATSATSATPAARKPVALKTYHVLTSPDPTTRVARPREHRLNPDFLRRYALELSAKARAADVPKSRLWDCVVLPPRTDAVPGDAAQMDAEVGSARKLPPWVRLDSEVAQQPSRVSGGPRRIRGTVKGAPSARWTSFTAPQEI